MSNYYEPKKRESYYMGDEDDWRVLWPKNHFETVFGKVPKEPINNDVGLKLAELENKKNQEREQLFKEILKNMEQPVLDAKGIKVSHYPTPARAKQVGGSHYKDKAMQPWDIIDAWELNFYAGNVVKYILRYRHKDGLQDLQKARHYIDKLIEDYADPK